MLLIPLKVFDNKVAVLTAGKNVYPIGDGECDKV